MREWQCRIYRLLIAEPEVAVELRRLLNDGIGSLRSDMQTPIVHLKLNAQASGHGRVYQVGQASSETPEP